MNFSSSSLSGIALDESKILLTFLRACRSAYLNMLIDPMSGFPLTVSYT